MGYMACIFAVLYFLVYYFSRYNISDTTKALEVYPTRTASSTAS